jgi:uncharacterized OB-fold protein
MGALPEDWTLPAVDDRTRAWFTSGELLVQRCADCGTIQHPPEEICHRCGSMSFGHVAVAPRGTVHSYTVAHHPVHPALADSVPYTIVLVSLDDAPEVRVVGNLNGGAASIGMPVEAYWEERVADGDVVRLPQWRPAGEREDAR